MGIEILMQGIWITVSSGKGIHRHKPSDGRIQVARSQIVEASICVKELACVQISIDCDTGFVKQISKGIVIVGVSDDCATGREGAGAAEAIIMIIGGLTVSGLGDQVMAVDVAHQQISAAVAFFQYLGVISVGINEVGDDNGVINTLADAVALGIIFVFHDNGDAEAGRFNADEPIFGVVEIGNILFGAGLFPEVAVVVVAVGDVIFLN